MKLIHTLNKDNENIDVFASEAFLKSRSSEYGWFVTDAYILPFIIDKKLFFKRMIFTTACLPLKKNTSIADEKHFLDAVIQKCKEENLCDFIYKAQANVLFNVCPESSECIEWGTYVVDIASTQENIFNNIHAKHRNRIRHAEKHGLIVQETDNIVQVCEIIKQTFTRQKKLLYPSLSDIQKLQDNLQEHIVFFEVLKENVPQGVFIFIFDDTTAYCIYAGSIEKPFSGSIALMHYKAMVFFNTKKLKNYDFMGARINVDKGSKFETIQHFKKRFGGELKQGYAFQTILKPLKFRFFNYLVKIYFKAKGSQFEDIIKKSKANK
ncbi:MAG: peptidoglycan bridge formation glycyltransferase FemA/FemB family protein [Sulfurimonas sp.]|nr:peptidoglycan bridge formation glycyltransferase FemA/FemB family protein [Sulfurimonas sp.]